MRVIASPNRHRSLAPRKHHLFFIKWITIKHCHSPKAQKHTRKQKYLVGFPNFIFFDFSKKRKKFLASVGVNCKL
ncbi:hypothetical protein M413DRAFT_440033 [Hebeloma cylindrosporum]|uniref:Uncharacterized protein n=1 Tax=Hebeloma cylindrosporum TaxID=76867 RepID=A0A0C2Z534_HEBCY|nr:hypothetical protein M413DRAFT_440033 [Hebeloma cylindrosporum h7]